MTTSSKWKYEPRGIRIKEAASAECVREIANTITAIMIIALWMLLHLITICHSSPAMGMDRNGPQTMFQKTSNLHCE